MKEPGEYGGTACVRRTWQFESSACHRSRVLFPCYLPKLELGRRTSNGAASAHPCSYIPRGLPFTRQCRQVIYSAASSSPKALMRQASCSSSVPSVKTRQSSSVSLGRCLRNDATAALCALCISSGPRISLRRLRRRSMYTLHRHSLLPVDWYTNQSKSCSMPSSAQYSASCSSSCLVATNSGTSL